MGKTLRPLSGKPIDHGFRMPAEWEPHAATWIAWPHNINDWPGRFAPIPWVYAEIVRNLQRSEQVCILVLDAAHEQRARKALQKSGIDLNQVRFYRVKTDRVWTRDSGPIFIKRAGKSQEVAITNWRFNAWAKYANHLNDDAVPDKVASLLKLPQWKPTGGTPERRIVLEGGSIDVNGAGILMTTEECLLSEVQQRNPGLSREDMEKVFHDYLGIHQVLWLKCGVAGDDTHGHVDDLARFTDENTIVIVTESDKADVNYEPLRENRELLKRARNLNGKPFRIVLLPMPKPVYFDGQRLPASYANFYIANGIVLVPTFNDPADRHALNTLQKLFPKRLVVGIHCVDLIWGLGALHCMTQQQPLGA